MDEQMDVTVVPAYGTKVCPRCGGEVFEDMDVCYDCLYEFSGASEDDRTWSNELVPVDAYEGDVAQAGVSGRMRMRVRSDDVEVVLGLPESGLLVGRGSGCDVILHGRSVSRRHVLVVPDGDGALVRDQGSTNLATMGKRKVDHEARMSVGDVLNVCGVTFSLEPAT